MTIREHLEAIRRRNDVKHWQGCGCFHCLDAKDAVAALAQLDAAERAPFDCTDADYRLVRDPEPDASRNAP